MGYKRKAYLFASATAFIAAPLLLRLPARAQDAAAQADVVDEIVVTAQRRTERVQDVPIAVGRLQQ